MAIDKKGREVKAKRIGDVIIVANQNKKTNADEEYYYTRLQLKKGKELELLFTEEQIQVAIERANKNPEDLPEIHWLLDLLD